MGTIIEILSLVRTVVDLREIFTISPVTSPTSTLSPTLTGSSIKIVNPLIKLSVTFWNPKPIPTPRAPANKLSALKSIPTAWIIIIVPINKMKTLTELAIVSLNDFLRLDLAKILNAATACSKPVSDAGWRPHHEHVGQTGIKISPNIYFAIGISGAIQHLAGVNSSKKIIVINNDPEAPFFKSADYGIVGDAFEVVPKIIEALK